MIDSKDLKKLQYVYVKIPFRVQFREAMLTGNKITTARPRPMGLPGQMFVAFGARFCLDLVEPIRLEVVRDDFYQLEGLSSPKEFVEVWNSIHPFKGFNPTDTVYIHRFFRVPVHYPKRDREKLIHAFGKDAIEAADKIMVVSTDPHPSGSCKDPECWCNSPELTIVHDVEVKPKRRRSSKKKGPSLSPDKKVGDVS